MATHDDFQQEPAPQAKKSSGSKLLLILGIIGSVYDNSKQVTRVNDTISRLQENGRFAIQLGSK